MTDRCDDPSAGPYTDTPGKKIAPCLMTGDLMPPVEAFQDRSELAAGDGERRRRTGSLPLETPIHRKTEPSRSAPRRTDSGKSGFPPVVPVPNFSDPASGKERQAGSGHRPRPPETSIRPTRTVPTRPDDRHRRQRKRAGKEARRENRTRLSCAPPTRTSSLPARDGIDTRFAPFFFGPERTNTVKKP